MDYVEMSSVQSEMESSPCELREDTGSDDTEESSGARKSIGLQDHDYCVRKELAVNPAAKKLKPTPPPLIIKSEVHEEETPRVSGLYTPTVLKEFAILAAGLMSPLAEKNLPFRKRAHSVPDAGEDSALSDAPMTPTFMPSKTGSPLGEDPEWSPPLNLSLPPTPKDFKAEEIENHNGLSGYSYQVSPNLSARKEATQRIARAPGSGPLSSRPVVPNVILDSGRVASQQPQYHSQLWNPFCPTTSSGTVHCFNGPSSLGKSKDDLQMTTASYSLTAPAISQSSRQGEGWQAPWPQPVWHSFQAGTLIRFRLGGPELTVTAEDVKYCSELQRLYPDSLGPLMVIGIELVDRATAVDLKFVTTLPNSSTEVTLVASCRLHQALWVKEKGWCAVVPDAVYQKYGVRCKLLECLDRCSSPLDFSSPGICDNFKRFSFSPDVLSRQHGPLSPPNTPTQKSKHQQSSTQSAKQQKTGKLKSSIIEQVPVQAATQRPEAKCALDPNRPKRPMNGFMLFARQHRLKLIQMHPGKDNRFVSVILGEAWKQLPADQKAAFVAEAKALSDERKLIYPECWKRKRSQTSTSFVKTEAAV